MFLPIQPVVSIEEHDETVSAEDDAEALETLVADMDAEVGSHEDEESCLVCISSFFFNPPLRSPSARPLPASLLIILALRQFSARIPFSSSLLFARSVPFARFLFLSPSAGRRWRHRGGSRGESLARLLSRKSRAQARGQRSAHRKHVILAKKRSCSFRGRSLEFILRS